MEFVARTSELLQELALVQGVVERKTTMPILSNVRMEARESKQGGELEIVATDLEVGIRTLCGAVVKKPGVMTLPARRLHEIIRLLPDSEVEFKAPDGAWVSVICERTRYRLPGAATGDFPNLPEYDFGDAIRLSLDELKGMIERVIFAISLEDPRYSVHGAQLNVSGGGLTLVATDGHRLAIVSRTSPGLGGAEMKLLIPRKTLLELLRMEPGAEGDVQVGVHGRQMFFRSGRRVLLSNTPEGDFPAYERVIPEKNDRVMMIGAEALRGALGRVALLSEERSKQVRFSLASGKLIVSTQNPEMGEAEEHVPAEYDGPAFQIGFNAKYVVEFLQVAGGGNVRLELKDDSSPGLMRPEGQEEMDYRYVVMPMRLN